MSSKKLFILMLIIFCSPISYGDAYSYIKFNHKLMDEEWNFLPEVPSSFKNNSYKELEFSNKYQNIQTTYKNSKLNLELERNSEPKEAKLDADKQEFLLSYYLNDKNILYLRASNQDSETQKFNCYQFSNYIIGSCNSANLQINSTNEKYEILGNNIISISGSTKTNGFGYQRNYDLFWIQASYVEFLNTNYSYKWLSPIEDIKSPILLNIVIDNIKLGDAISDALMRLPQRNDWKTNQLNIGFKQKFYSIYNFNLIAEYDFVYIEFKNYIPYKEIPEFNFRFRAGIEFKLGYMSLLMYGDLYKNNLVGFEPITFNQRTEHYFDQSYGELGLSLQFTF